MTEAATREDLAALRSDVADQMTGVRADIKELTAALRDLVRIDGNTKRLDDAMRRIGIQVDDHEGRLRKVEEKAPQGVHANKLLMRVIEWILMSGAGAAVMYLAPHVVKR